MPRRHNKYYFVHVPHPLGKPVRGSSCVRGCCRPAKSHVKAQMPAMADAGGHELVTTAIKQLVLQATPAIGDVYKATVHGAGYTHR